MTKENKQQLEKQTYTPAKKVRVFKKHDAYDRAKERDAKRSYEDEVDDFDEER